MPGTFAALDQNLPRFTGEEPLERRVQLLQDYQYQLLEQLRYILSHLDTRNFNMTEINSWTGTITDPIYGRIEDAEGNLTQLAVTAQGIAARVSDAEGNITSLQVAAKGLSSQVKDAQGNISSLQQTATAIQSTVSNQAGQISSLQQTATAIQTRVSSAEGNISTLAQTASSIQTAVSNQAGQLTSIRQSVDSISLGVYNGDASSTIFLYKDGIAVSSQNVSFTGMVSFNDLSGAGRSVIYGGNILTDSLYLDSLHGDNVYLYNRYGGIGAEFRIGNASSAYDRCELWARAIMLGTNGGHIYLDSGAGTLEVGDYNVQANANVIPNRPNMFSCGSYAFPWADVYSQDGTVSSSDGRGKKDVDYDMGRYSGLFDRLRPCSFLRTNGTSGRRHHGFIAQEVREALEAEGMTGKDFAGYVDWEDGEDQYGYGLRYEEMIAMIVYEVQEIKKKIGG